MLDECATYLSMPEGASTSLLESTLRSAVLKVQSYADRAIVATTMRLRATPTAGRISLYQGGGTIVSVTDALGNALSYEQPAPDIVNVGISDEVVVTYTTTPEAGNVDALKLVIYRYATALYDGETTDTLGAILNEALC